MNADTIKSNVGAGYLQTKLNKTLLENFEPNLFFAKMWEKPMVDNGVGTLMWAKPSKLSVTAATATLTEWTAPNSTAFSYNTITTTPTQYGIFVSISDRLIKAAPTKITTDAAKEVGNNMARIVDQVIQTEIMAGTNVIYADSVANRAALGAGNTLWGAEIKNAVVKLRSLDAPTIDGTYYMAIAHPFVIWDLQGEANGAWIEFSKYATPDKLFKGEVWALYGCRFAESSNVQTFASTVTVYPTLVMWKGAYWVAEWSSLEAIYNPVGSGGSSDPLSQVATVGSKIDFAAKRLQEDAMVRIESAANAV